MFHEALRSLQLPPPSSPASPPSRRAPLQDPPSLLPATGDFIMRSHGLIASSEGDKIKRERLCMSFEESYCSAYEVIYIRTVL